MVEQYSYSPYGVCEANETPASHPVNRVGHQGLFFDRLDASPIAGDQLTTGAAGFYQNRNRVYRPDLARFLQRDPNASAIPLLISAAMNGGSVDPLLEPFGIDGFYVDGMNLYVPYGNNPLTNRDPMGLSYNPYDDFIDQWTADYHAERVAFANELMDFAANLGRTVAHAALVGAVTAIFPPAGLVFSAKGIADTVLRMWETGEIGIWDIVQIGADLAGLKISLQQTFRMAKRLERSAAGLGARYCNSFVAGTMVDTPAGPVPIESLVEGDEVMTVNQFEPSQIERAGTVTRVFRSIAPAILWITFANGTALGTTPDHEVWTNEDGWTKAKRVEVGDSFATRAGSCVVVTNVVLDPTPTRVFNLEIEGTFTYFVSDLWVHNCTPGSSGAGMPSNVKRLTESEIKTLKNAGYDIHELKGKKGASKLDIFKDKHGNLFVKPKDGSGPGDPLGININKP